jgi:hypothetical protein
MAIDKVNGKIRVYNYGFSPVGFPSNHIPSGVFIRGRSEDEEFVVERVHWDDIESENTKSDIFKIGLLRFHPDEEDEIYKKLGIEDRENIMADYEMIEFLMTEGIETIKRISNINSMALITRMKSMLFQMERIGKRASHDVVSAVSERLNELISGSRRNPNSVISRILEAEKEKIKKDQLEKTLEDITKRVNELEREREEQTRIIKEKDELLRKSQNAIEDLLKQVEKLTKQNKNTTKKSNKDSENVEEDTY